MTENTDRGRLAEGVQLDHEKQVKLAHTLQIKGYSTAAIADIMRIPARTVRSLLEQSGKTNLEQGFNCLTQGVHHGRPEAIWNLPLGYATQIYGQSALEEIVVARIYNDAIELVTLSPFTPSEGESFSFTQEWADRMRIQARADFSRLLDRKVAELGEYYTSSVWHNDVRRVQEGIRADKLNPHYAPLHGHDTINMLCRILGTHCDRTVEQ